MQPLLAEGSALVLSALQRPCCAVVKLGEFALTVALCNRLRHPLVRPPGRHYTRSIAGTMQVFSCA